ncbi:uncharacterized protein LOC9330619 isoform X2 [Arabidopsis lyrata subsp. lyrata]|uniref:uncharacterized protein LOC9330619 isoform X2 n=1 Tax=Arabidopsis lyrata subsp. lyrata TaxID=81972 RepID=UPI000A29CBCB|nr:uncharacterized protein LOC9330619 isoform X2 [Arabidopsis lyrata subsp. lyrata]|eukprot:XP_020866800.1 uncharacterized protein LOC9330619 isoform X2 [Arabidopsis lyrata subsp. lyrata]
MPKSRPFACNVLNPTQPPFMLTVLASPISSYTVSTLASISSPSNNITNLLSRERKREVKTVLKACENELSTVGPNTLSEAETALTTGDYDKTAKSIKLALGIPHGCRFELQRIKFESFELYSQINIYTQLSDAAMRIIDRF